MNFEEVVLLKSHKKIKKLITLTSSINVEGFIIKWVQVFVKSKAYDFIYQKGFRGSFLLLQLFRLPKVHFQLNIIISCH